MSMFEISRALTLGQVVVGLVTFAVIRTVHFYINRSRIHKTFKRLNIPGPEPSLYDGNQSEYYRYKSWQVLDREWMNKYGETFGIYVGDMPVLISKNLDFLQGVFLNNSEVFQSRTRLVVDTFPLSSSVIFTTGDRWRAMRKLLNPAFSRYRVMGEESTKFIDDSIGKMIKYIDARFQAEGDSIEVDILPLMKSTALHLISSMALHVKDIEISEKSYRVFKLDKYLKQMSPDDKHSPLRWIIRFPFIGTLLGLVMNKISFGTIKEILGNLNKEINLILIGKGHEGRQTSVLTQMTHLYKDTKMTRDEVLGNSLALLIAGYETTSTTLSYIFYALGSHTDVQDKLRQELSRDGMNSKYLIMVINETMRLYNTVTTFTQRTPSRDITVNGIQIEKGTLVVFNSPLVHHDPKIWPEPMKFDPERFEEGKKHHPCAFAPFGIGQRICIGYQLAMLEMKHILTEVLTRYNIELIGPKELNPLETTASVLTKPTEPVRIRLTRIRTNPNSD